MQTARQIEHANGAGLTELRPCFDRYVKGRLYIENFLVIFIDGSKILSISYTRTMCVFFVDVILHAFNASFITP